PLMTPSEQAGTQRAGERPEFLSGYRILSEIGRGGMGQVWLAHDQRLDRKVAVKTLQIRFQDDAQVRHRFMQKARALAKLKHPNIVQIYTLGTASEPPHFVMEYLEGGSLTDAAEPLTLEDKIELFHEIVLAVAFLHRHHIVHRDLKPSNVKVGVDLQ